MIDKAIGGVEKQSRISREKMDVYVNINVIRKARKSQDDIRKEGDVITSMHKNTKKKVKPQIQVESKVPPYQTLKLRNPGLYLKRKLQKRRFEIAQPIRIPEPKFLPTQKKPKKKRISKIRKPVTL